jgi:hypothetical protein
VVIEETVKGLSYRTVVCPVLGRQSRAPNERVDFSFAQLNHHTPQVSTAALAMKAHACGRRRMNLLSCGGRRHGGSSVILDHPSRASSRAPLLRTDNIKDSLR